MLSPVASHAYLFKKSPTNADAHCILAVPADLVCCQQKCMSGVPDLHVLHNLLTELLAQRWRQVLGIGLPQDWMQPHVQFLELSNQ